MLFKVILRLLLVFHKFFDPKRRFNIDNVFRCSFLFFPINQELRVSTLLSCNGLTLTCGQ